MLHMKQTNKHNHQQFNDAKDILCKGCSSLVFLLEGCQTMHLYFVSCIGILLSFISIDWEMK